MALTFSQQFQYISPVSLLHIASASLDETHFVVVYQYVNNPYYTAAVIGTISSGSISYGSEFTIDTTETSSFSSLSVTKIDSTSFIVAYDYQFSGDDYSASRVGVVSGSNISFGSEYFFTSSSEIKEIKLIDSTHALIVFCYDISYSYGGASKAAGIVCTITGTDLSFGSAEDISMEVEHIIGVSVCMLSSTKFVTTYFNTTTEKDVVKIGTISGTTLSFGSENIIKSANVETLPVNIRMSISTIDSTHFLIAYHNTDGLNYGIVFIGTVTGNSVSFGIEYTFNSGYTKLCRQSLQMINPYQFIITYVTYTSPGINIASAIQGTIVEGLIELTSGSVYNNYNAADGGIHATTVVSDTKTIISFINTTNNASSRGASIITTTTYPPNNSTEAVTSIGTNSATGNGTIIYTGNPSPTKRGVVFSPTSHTNPGNISPASSAYEYKVEETGSYSTGSFTEAIVSLISRGTYYIRSYSYNSAGYGYGLELSFTTNGFTNPGNIFADDTTYTTLTASSGDLNIELSKDGGVNWNPMLTKTLTGSDTTVTYGNGRNELWGASWTRNDVDDTSFRVRLSSGQISQVYKDFGFTSGSQTLTGIEISVKGHYTDPTLYLDLLNIKIYYGTSVNEVKEGSEVFASDGRKVGEGAGNGTGVVVFYDGNTWNSVDSGQPIES